MCDGECNKRQICQGGEIITHTAALATNLSKKTGLATSLYKTCRFAPTFSLPNL